MGLIFCAYFYVLSFPIHYEQEHNTDYVAVAANGGYFYIIRRIRSGPMSILWTQKVEHFLSA